MSSVKYACGSIWRAPFTLVILIKSNLGAKGEWRRNRFLCLLDSDLGDEAVHFFVGHIVERALVFFFQALAEIFGGFETCFAVGEVAPGLFAKLDEGGVGQANDAADAIDFEFGIDGIAVAGGGGVPDMRKAAIVEVAAKFGSDFKGANELVHGTVVR